MKLTVLGKYGPYGKAGCGAASGYLIEDDGFKMLLDMGSGTLSRMLSYITPDELDGIFISHLHYDHTSDLLPFRYLLDETQTKIKIYTEKSDSEWYRLLFAHPLFEIINVDENSKLTIKGKEIEFFRMNHPVPDLAIKIKGNGTFAYTGDTVYNENLIPLLNGCSLAVCDCSKPDHFIGGHMTAKNAHYLTENTNVKMILASHAAPDYEPKEEFSNNDRITVAEELKTYEF